MELYAFDIRLDEQNNKMLRPNMKVDVFLVTDSQQQCVESGKRRRHLKVHHCRTYLF